MRSVQSRAHRKSQREDIRSETLDHFVVDVVEIQLRSHTWPGRLLGQLTSAKELKAYRANNRMECMEIQMHDTSNCLMRGIITTQSDEGQEEHASDESFYFRYTRCCCCCSCFEGFRISTALLNLLLSVTTASFMTSTLTRDHGHTYKTLT